MLFLLIAAVFANEKLWAKWKVDYNTTYTTKAEHDERYAIFVENLQKIDAHNAQGLSWTMGINQFTDMTQAEFAQYVQRGNGGGFVHLNKDISELNIKELGPATCTSVDWVGENKVTPVKNQGQCGSCWSFSTTGAIESRVAIKQGTLKILSEQELVDCDTKDSACNGGLMDYAFEYVMSNHGLCQENDYAYTSGSTEKAGTCRSSRCTHYDAISSYTDVTPYTQSELEAALCEGPVSIAIEADQRSFQNYNGGILTSDCGSNLDHGVLLVGMGTENGVDYWNVKNSWGGDWGESGYIRLVRNAGKNCQGIFTKRCSGQCGLMQQPSYPVV